VSLVHYNDDKGFQLVNVQFSRDYNGIPDDPYFINTK